MKQRNIYLKGFIPYALAAFMISLVGGFSAVLGPAFVQDMGINPFKYMFLCFIFHTPCSDSSL